MRFTPSQLLIPLLLLGSALLAASPLKLPLWDGDAPEGEGKFSPAPTAAISVHLPEPAQKPTGAAMVICPGGGYGGLVTGAEGHGIATWLNTQGIAGIVLEYRLPAGRPFVPLLDAQRALRTVRHRASEWGIDANRLGIIGFSAGGHLASTAATHFDKGKPGDKDPVEHQSSRPDFAILVYPVISMGQQGHAGSRKNLLGSNPSPGMVDLFSNELQVRDDSPPAFLAHAKDDKVVPIENSILFHKAQKAHRIPGKLLELERGGHGLNGYRGPMWDAWQTQSLQWLRSVGTLGAARPQPSAP